MTKDEDRLGRKGFAESLADAIKGWKNKDSLVVAVYGAWGSGKTSLKNMIIDSLKQSEENGLTIVEFNPWQWAGQEQLFSAFFAEIGSCVGKKDKSGKGNLRAKKWRAYGAYLKMGSILSKTLRKLVIAFLVIIGILGLGGAILTSHWVKTTLLIVGLAGFVLAAFAKWGEGFSESLANVFQKRSELHEKGLSELKKELAIFLVEIENPILVVIDDIDRLTKQDTKLLFQLVKANADFPNVIYLLLFQRNIVEKNLEILGSLPGRDFLDKIIQVGFDIPKIERTRLERILFEGLDEILGIGTVNQRFDQHRWGNMYIGGLRIFFSTLRDVHRYLGMLSFHTSLFQNTGAFEVNPIDLIALEVIRVFEPSAYHRIASSKFELTERQSSLHGDDDYKKTESVVASIVSQVKEDRQLEIRDLLKQLFPFTEKVGYSDESLEEWYRDLRVCHPNVFDKYFHLTIPEGDISQAELDTILNFVGHRDALVKEFAALKQRNLLGVMLERLEAYKQKIDIIHALPFVTALFDIGDELPEAQPSFYSLGPESHLRRILFWYLMQEKNVEKRETILIHASQASSGIYLLMETVSLEQDKRFREKQPEKYLVQDDQSLEKLKSICLKKIEVASTSNVLKDHPKLIYILYQWLKWGKEDQVKAWVKALVQTSSGALSFLASILNKGTSQSLGDHVGKVHWTIRLRNIQDFVSIDEIKRNIDGLDVEKLNEKEKLAVKAFHRALRRREQGISDEDWRHDDEE